MEKLQSTDFDELLRKASAKYMPDVDWRLYKAQLYQESRLDPDAVSPVGAKGIAQFMPGTWRDVSYKVGAKGSSPHDYRVAILAGAYYMAALRRQWHAPRPEADRHCLALASYNAGMGSLLAAQKHAGGANLYKDIAASLHKATGDNSAETLGYVERIWAYYTHLLIGR